ncbi:ribosome biogenesis GTPase Der [Pokkaliibacter sp. CJK22405]|uniref:ribosome biogenesis GTPase Der n=1 Tax=Pokkaliibacter sp. CJK22405 TaxID=3384615 RepID=UPI003984A3AB
MNPVVALVGRPNVGKSTLFNRLTRTNDALVADMPGVTRDRKYGEGRVGDHAYIVVDTGGISGEEVGLDMEMAEQSLLAIEEADIVLFLVDGRAGLTPADEMIAQHLRRSEKKAWLVVNKTDGLDPDIAMGDFFSLGLHGPFPIAAAHGRGVRSLIEEALAEYPVIEEQERELELASKGIRIGVVGRPNVGKSTLVNRMLGEDRVVVYDYAGTTRDSIYIPYTRNDQDYTLIDTAGIRRRRSVHEAIEKFSIVKTLQAIKDSHVVICVLDARDGLSEQDLHLIGFVIESGRAMVIAVNKWDGMTQDQKDEIRRQLDRRLSFAHFADLHFISALHGTAVGDLYKSVNDAYDSAMAKWSTNRLTKLLQDCVQDHQPPIVKGRRIKLRYAHQGGSNPPLFIVHGNSTQDLPGSYQRYLENRFAQVLDIKGTPVRFSFKGGDNPFAEKQKPKSAREMREEVKKRRLVRNIKRNEKKG